MTRGFSLALSLLLLIQGFAFSPSVYAQSRAAVREGAGDGEGETSQTSRQAIAPSSRGITVLPPVNMSALAAQGSLAPAQAGGAMQIKPIHPPRGIDRTGFGVPIAGSSGGDEAPAAPEEQAPVPSGTGQSPPPTKTFKSDQLDLGSIPPDTMGAVGPNHVVTTTNEKVITHTRAGVVLSSVTLDAFWATVLLGGTPPSTFDPKIYYDRFNSRYIIVTTADAQIETSATLFAVSQTNDPLGTWNRYAIDADAAATATGGKWADYPSVGFNKNWIAIQVNLFGFGSVSGFQGPAIYVINKAAAYANTLSTVSTFEGSFATCLASATQETELACGFTMTPAITEDNTTETLYLNEDWDSTAGQLRLSKITGTPAAPVLTIGTQFPQSPNSWRFNAPIIGTSGGYMLQRQQNIYAISGNRITANDSRIQNSVLRNGSLWSVHHVMLPTVPTAAGVSASTAANPDNHTGVQWWQINPTIETGAAEPPIQRGRIEDPTADNCHNGSGGLRTAASVPPCPAPQGQFFAFTNIAVNQNNDVLIGYSRFSHLTLPKAAYSYRAGTDPANTMRDSQTFREGVGNYNIGAGSPFNIRWGDYSAAMVDPVNDTDFWTIQEFADFQREVFGPGQFAGVWATWWAQIKPTSTSSTSGNLLITEFRLRGPAGPRDEFVELYNPTNNPITVTTTDGSDGWALAYSTNGTTVTALTAIPNGTTIPAHGHYLIENNVAAAGIAPYSLEGYPNVVPGPGINGSQVRPSDGDAMYTPDLADNGGVAIFRTGNPANMNAGTRMDSVGFATIAAGLFKEGTGIPNITGTPTGQLSFVRNISTVTGYPQDTDNNSTDFTFVDPVNETLGVTPRGGAAGPENIDSPINRGASIGLSLLDRTAPETANTAPNRVKSTTPVTNGSLGTLAFRRVVVNNTGGPITRLRFRVVDITTRPSPVGTADLRAISSANVTVTGVTDATTCAYLGLTSPCSVPVTGLAIEEPPTQALGGGLNTTYTLSLGAPLPNNGTAAVQFMTGIEQGGSFRFLVIIEALP
jgi:hypothetical protein